MDVSQYVPYAQKTEELYGIPTSVTLGQIILESSGNYNGQSYLAYKGNNLFGVKGSVSNQGTGGLITATTSEYKNGQKYSTSASFKKYNSPLDSIIDHGILLTTNRYLQNTKNATSVEEYASAIQKSGYATDPNYSNKLVNIINSNGLNKYNVGSWKSTTSTMSPSTGKASTDYIKNGSNTSSASTSFDSSGLNVFGQIARMIIILLIIGMILLFVLNAIGINPTRRTN
jgi:flagellum-specific peptidoglycan hydrolase FlgJ